MAGTGASSTPSPYRVDVPIVGTHNRSEYDKELWDDLANVIYYVTDDEDDNVAGGTSAFFCEITIPCPIKCRLEIHARVTPATFPGVSVSWRVAIQVDGVDVTESGTQKLQPGPGTDNVYTANVFAAPDVEAGSHIVRMRIAPGTIHPFGFKQIMVRRGRTPPS